MLSGAAMKSPPLIERLSVWFVEAWNERAVLLKAMSFAIVGVVNAIVDFSVFSFAYFYLGLPIIAANLISWSVAVTGSYVLNSQFTFATESGRQLRFADYVKFVLTQIGGFIANTATVFVVAHFLPALFRISPDRAVLVGKVLAIGASFIVNFSLSHFVVFRRREHGSDH
jgi:putative flippase GtrA